MEFTIELRAELTAEEFAGVVGTLEACQESKRERGKLFAELAGMVKDKLMELIDQATAEVEPAEAAEKESRGAKPDQPAFSVEPEGDPDDEYLRAKAADDLERRLAEEGPEEPEGGDEE